MAEVLGFEYPNVLVRGQLFEIPGGPESGETTTDDDHIGLLMTLQRSAALGQILLAGTPVHGTVECVDCGGHEVNESSRE
ncbi:hypothetical protein HCU01_30910 [Halomonas cupida]|uniref:Uncharacterized protein n=1 Tax=Halomonas cupida TaxID=44933 RepID=A0ABQ0WHP2_9GAMM|nr:hypothetical protein HCU01_30910 [Halomonas cupida]